MTDKTIAPSQASPKAPSVDSVSSTLAGIGLVTIVALICIGVVMLGKSLFYDGAFNDGFEAGRASVVAACKDPGRACPI